MPASFYADRTWSQCGEDRILLHLFGDLLESRSLQYVDIGANHPFHFSNTALFYKLGGRGVLVEPNPKLASVLRMKRSRDLVLQCGVSIGQQREADYFMFDAHTLNTFSAEEAARYIRLGQMQTGVIKAKLRGVNDILGMVEHLDFVNLDVEGVDFEILRSIDWVTHRPKALCVETISFEMGGEPTKRGDIIEFVERQGYHLYADTHVNTIFVENAFWKGRFKSQDVQAKDV